jgi:hypothetical protein
VKKTDVEAEKTVAGLEKKWLQSQKTNNPDMVAPLLADNFVNTGSDGKVTSKDESLATAKATKYDNVDYENLKVTIFGNTAIALATLKLRAPIAPESPWMFMNGLRIHG